jgi:nucleoside-diphosphate kinase
MTRTATATATTATNAFNTAHKKRFSSSSLSPNKVQNNRRCLRHPKHAATVVVAGRFPDERTYIMIKPDGVQRGKVGAIIERFENKGMQLKGLKTFQCTRAVAEEHYRDLSSKPFFKDLVDYIISGPVVCMIWQGPTGTVAAARKMIGETNPLESLPGSIRGDYAVEVGRNIIHGSDSVESAEREINLWFADGNGVVDWEMTNNGWIRE